MRGHGAPHLTLLRALALAVFCCSAAFVIVMLSDGSLLTRREGGAAPRRLLPPQAQAPLSATAQPDATGAGAAQGRRDGTPQQQASGNASSSELYDIGSWRHSKPPEVVRVLHQQGGGLAGEQCLFVRADQRGLTLGAGRWVLAGATLPDHAIDLAASGAAGRARLLGMMEEARRAGLNALRVLAFKDGHTLPHAMQVAPGLLDERVMREGLDWLVWQARRFSLRLVLVLTSARWPVARRRGGAAQYVRWQSPDPAGGTLHDFLTNDTFKARYFDYLTALAVRKNHFTGLQHRHDPTIAAWDLGEGLADAAPRGGDALQAWIPYVALHLRRTDPNHLIMCSGGGGLFGPASPHHVHLNPALQMRMPWVLPPGDANSSGPRGQPSQRAAAACEGVDFVRNSMLQELDLSVAEVRPDEWLSCNDACKLSWAESWVAAHVRDALRMQKPLLLSAVHTAAEAGGGAWGRQRALQAMVARYLARAISLGMPVAGMIVPLPSTRFEEAQPAGSNDSLACGAAGSGGCSPTGLPSPPAASPSSESAEQPTAFPSPRSSSITIAVTPGAPSHPIAPSSTWQHNGTHSLPGASRSTVSTDGAAPLQLPLWGGATWGGRWFDALIRWRAHQQQQQQQRPLSPAPTLPPQHPAETHSAPPPRPPNTTVTQGALPTGPSCSCPAPGTPPARPPPSTHWPPALRRDALAARRDVWQRAAWQRFMRVDDLRACLAHAAASELRREASALADAARRLGEGGAALDHQEAEPLGGSKSSEDAAADASMARQEPALLAAQSQTRDDVRTLLVAVAEP